MRGILVSSCGVALPFAGVAGIFTSVDVEEVSGESDFESMLGFDVVAARDRAIGGESMGLLGMQERVSLVGGKFEVRSGPDGGTEVRARFAVGADGQRAQ